MKLMYLVLALGLIAVAWASLWGRATVSTVRETVNQQTSPEFDVRLAREAVTDLRRELLNDQRNLSRLQREVQRNQEEIQSLREGRARLAEQIERGGALLTESGPYQINGHLYTKAQVEAQVEAYLSQRASQRQQQKQREGHQVRLQQKLAEMQAAIANKRLQVEEYEGRIALLEIDVRFLSRADRYQVASGNTSVQAIIDRLSDKVDAQRASTPQANGIDFIATDIELQERIQQELAQP